MSSIVKEKKINLNGKEYNLRFDFLAIAEFEKNTGKNFFKIGKEFSATDTVSLLQSMIISGGQKISFEDTARGMSPNNMSEINEVIEELISDGKIKKEDTGNSAVGSGDPLEEKPQSL